MEAVMRVEVTVEEWSSLKWQVDAQPSIVKALAANAYIETHGIQPTDLEMSEGLWKRGCIIKWFLYVYSVYMVVSTGQQYEEEWGKAAIVNISQWLFNDTNNLQQPAMEGQQWLQLVQTGADHGHGTIMEDPELELLEDPLVVITSPGETVAPDHPAVKFVLSPAMVEQVVVKATASTVTAEDIALPLQDQSVQTMILMDASVPAAIEDVEDSESKQDGKLGIASAEVKEEGRKEEALGQRK
ncbi:hypothetical protein M422DRAFT_268052 [Sphaerobolus stellatus SS14]|uniref:Uncharacterized protein n=1 Tax=Sphaerobolus stellatus (strain SS14) TaxID=990650 RepID=A0A0C9UNJ5_SPHS4|nr:hypothetical protein M422DRAFT_268052 [Sphaerobolus stellatus SS14]